MANQLNVAGNLENNQRQTAELLKSLKVGQTLLTKVIKTKRDGMVQIEIAERVTNPNATSSLGDGVQTMYAFANGNSGSPRRFWGPIETIYLETMLDVEDLDLENGEYAQEPNSRVVMKQVMYLNIINPTAYFSPHTGEACEVRMRARVVETTDETAGGDYKINPTTKDPVLHNGQHIYNKNMILFTENLSDDAVIEHVFLASDVASVTSKVEEAEVLESIDLENSELGL